MALAAFAACSGVGSRAKAPFKAAAAAAVVGNAARARPLCMATPRKAAAAHLFTRDKRAHIRDRQTIDDVIIIHVISVKSDGIDLNLVHRRVKR